MATTSYNKILEDAKRLDRIDQLRLLEEIAGAIRKKYAEEEKRSLLELAGLGKELWQNIDVEKYVDTERESWNG